MSTEQVTDKVQTEEVKVIDKVDTIIEKLESGVARCSPTIVSAAPDCEFPSLCQGEKRFQYIGLLLPDGAYKETVTTLTAGWKHAIGGSSHILHLPAGARVVKPEVEHPLIELFVYLPSNHRLLVEHDEHAWLHFDKRGWYAVRNDRAPTVSENEAAQSLKARVD